MKLVVSLVVSAAFLIWSFQWLSYHPAPNRFIGQLAFILLMPSELPGNYALFYGVVWLVLGLFLWLVWIAFSRIRKRKR